MEDKKIKLDFPIKIKTDKGEISVDEISIGRLKTKHLKLLPKGFSKKAAENDLDPSDMIPLIAGMSGMSEEDVGEIDVKDLFKIVGEMEDFLGTARTRGKK